jgi:hypothetical protein
MSSYNGNWHARHCTGSIGKSPKWCRTFSKSITIRAGMHGSQESLLHPGVSDRQNWMMQSLPEARDA